MEKFQNKYLEIKNINKDIVDWLENIADENNCRIERKEWKSKYVVIHPQMPFGWESEPDADFAEELTLNLIRDLLPDCEKYGVGVRAMANHIRSGISNEILLENYDFERSVADNSKLLKEKGIKPNSERRLYEFKKWCKKNKIDIK